MEMAEKKKNQLPTAAQKRKKTELEKQKVQLESMKFFHVLHQQMDGAISALRKGKRALIIQKYGKIELKRTKIDTHYDEVDYVLDGIEEQMSEIDSEFEEKRRKKQIIIVQENIHSSTPQKSNDPLQNRYHPKVKKIAATSNQCNTSKIDCILKY